MVSELSFLNEPPRAEYVVVRKSRSPPRRLHSASYGRSGSRSRGRASQTRQGSSSAVKRAYIRRKESRDRSFGSNYTFAVLNDSRNWDGE